MNPGNIKFGAERAARQASYGIIVPMARLALSTAAVSVEMKASQSARDLMSGGEPVLLVANHPSMWDIPLVGLTTIELGSDIPAFVANSNLFDFENWSDFWDKHPDTGKNKRRLLGAAHRWALWVNQSIPLDKQDKAQTARALMSVVAQLKQGGRVCLFPEGQLTEAYRDQSNDIYAARLSYLAKAPIVPIKIEAANDCLPFSWPRGDFTVRVGQPMAATTKANLQDVANQISKFLE